MKRDLDREVLVMCFALEKQFRDTYRSGRDAADSVEALHVQEDEARTLRRVCVGGNAVTLTVSLTDGALSVVIINSHPDDVILCLGAKPA